MSVLASSASASASASALSLAQCVQWRLCSPSLELSRESRFCSLAPLALAPARLERIMSALASPSQANHRAHLVAQRRATERERSLSALSLSLDQQEQASKLTLLGQRQVSGSATGQNYPTATTTIPAVWNFQTAAASPSRSFHLARGADSAFPLALELLTSRSFG